MFERANVKGECAKFSPFRVMLRFYFQLGEYLCWLFYSIVSCGRGESERRVWCPVGEPRGMCGGVVWTGGMLVVLRRVSLLAGKYDRPRREI